MKTDDINTIVHEFTVKKGARPAPLHYRGFPKSVCVSVNEVVCHGIPGPRVLEDGDIVNIDITSVLDGYYADANQTFFVGTPGPDVGHGVGFEFHEAPQVPHFGQRGQGIRLIPGMVFTIEPMINLGNHDLKILEDNWTAVTKDNSLSAQFEQTILVTQGGYESLTPYELS